MDFSFLGKLAPPGGTADADEFVKGELMNMDQEFTDPKDVDYQIGPPREDNKKNPPLSYTQITSEEEGVDWYRKHHPEYPDGVLRIMSRCAFGNPNAPVQDINTRTVTAPKQKEKPKFSVTEGEHVITFD